MQFFALLLLSLIHCIGASVPQCGTGQQYVVVPRHIMPGWSHQLKTTNRIQCLLACTNDTLCLSVNYNRQQEGVCRINKKTRYNSHGCKLLADSDFDYMERVICDEILCQDPLGVEDGDITDGQLIASSEYDGLGADRGRLYNDGGWVAYALMASSLDTNQWIQADLGDVKTVTGIITQGRSASNYRYQWVTSYAIHYRYSNSTGIEFEIMKGSNGDDKVFTANWDDDTAVTNMFNDAINAQFIRINPRTWDGWISMRFEVLGCTVHLC